jgi:hypothetical protein
MMVIGEEISSFFLPIYTSVSLYPTGADKHHNSDEER